MAFDVIQEKASFIGVEIGHGTQEQRFSHAGWTGQANAFTRFDREMVRPSIAEAKRIDVQAAQNDTF